MRFSVVIQLSGDKPVIQSVYFRNIPFFIKKVFNPNQGDMKIYEKYCVKKVGEKITLNQQKIIKNVQKNAAISARELSLIVGISPRKIEENIAKLKSIGIITRIGQAKGGYWEAVE